MLQPDNSGGTRPQIAEADRLLSVMREYWGYDSFLPLQERAMTAAVQGRDSLVVLPTGGGKSLCYQVPALCLEGMAVVISPLISLMKDQVDALRACGVPAAFINSTLTPGEKRNVAEDISERRLKLLYVAPERLSLQGLLDLLVSVDVSFFAIDEAHCVSMWGHDFRPHYRQLSVLREQFPGTAIHAYTATATKKVRSDVRRQLGLRDPEVLVGSFDRPNLTYRVERRHSLLGQVTDVLNRHEDESGIIYCITRREVDELCDSLSTAGYSSRPYHAGMTDEDRKDNQESFIEDRCRTIVATIAFGMGIDKSDVRYVIHAGLPKSLENYQQESGRAGRDGLEAECCLFYSGADYKTWEFIIEKSEGSGDFKRAQLTSLKRVMDYCDGHLCRHRALVQHFGQDLEADCGEACDLCLGEFEDVEDPLIVSQKILSSVYRQEQKFGADYTAKVLKGSKEQRICDNGHNRLSTHGLFREESRRTILDWIGQLIQQGFLVKEGEYSTLRITKEGWRLLRGEVSPRLLKPAGLLDVSSTRESSGTRTNHDPHSWEGVNRDLFEQLRALRTEKAVALGYAPYMVFGDASLRDMARRRPTSWEGFLIVHGVGQKKCDDYATEFISVISRFCNDQNIDSDVDPSPAEGVSNTSSIQNEGRSMPKSPSRGALMAFDLFDAGKSVEDVAEEMGRARSTTQGYLCEYLQHRQITDPVRWIAPSFIAEVESAIAEVGPSPLKPIKERVCESIDYDTIRIVSTCWINRHSSSTVSLPRQIMSDE